MAIPTEADFRSAIRPDLDRYLQGRNVPGRGRARLCRLEPLNEPVLAEKVPYVH